MCSGYCMTVIAGSLGMAAPRGLSSPRVPQVLAALLTCRLSRVLRAQVISKLPKEARLKAAQNVLAMQQQLEAMLAALRS